MPVREDFATNCWHVVASSDEVGPERPTAMTLAGQPLVLFRTVEGRVVALEDVCAHRHAPLSIGCVDARGIRCMYHGLLFAPDGQCIEIPGQDRIPPQAKVRAYTVAERHGWIWVWLGEAQADEGLLPPAIAGNHPDWITAQSHIDYDANYGLLVDNLLDFSHLSYVHAQSFKADPKWASVKPKVTPIDRGVQIERWIADAPALMSARHMGGQPTDTWQGYSFLAPGVLIMQTLYCKPGTAAAFNYEKPTSEIIVRNDTSQAVSAMGPRASRYFYATALPREGADQAICDRILSVSRAAFEEDRVMIEAQQKTIDRDPSRRPIPTAADNAVVIFHRILERLGGGASVGLAEREEERVAVGA